MASGGAVGETLTTFCSDGTLVISGSGNVNTTPWQDYADRITSVVVEAGITNVPNEAFYECDALADVSLPDGLESIGSSAFKKCSALSYIDIPDSVTSVGSSAFAFCYALTSIEISWTEVSSLTFNACTALTDVTFTDAVTTVYEHAFYNCTALESLIMPDSITYLDNAIFEGCDSLSAITFEGDMPQMNSEYYTETEQTDGWIQYAAFYKITAVVYYPRANSTWTDLRNYGGIITWEAY